MNQVTMKNNDDNFINNMQQTCINKSSGTQKVGHDKTNLQH